MRESKGAVDAPILACACQRIGDILKSVGCGRHGWVDGCSVGQSSPSRRRECHRGLVREENERRAGSGNFDIADIVSLVAINGLNISDPNRSSIRAKGIAKGLASPRDIVLLRDG